MPLSGVQYLTTHFKLEKIDGRIYLSEKKLGRFGCSPPKIAVFALVYLLKMVTELQ